MYVQRYHDVQVSKSDVWRILQRLDMNPLPASQPVRWVNLTYDALEPFTHDAGAERASSARHDAFCDSCPVLRAESSGCPDNGACGGTEPINECPIIGRSVIGALGASGGNRNGACSNRANIRPELVVILHLLLHSPTRSQETALVRAVNHSITTRTQGTTLQRASRSPGTLHADLPWDGAP